jgi:hypothetical protein
MKPIIFSTPMVQAILDGRKTQTRRVVKINGFPITSPKESLELTKEGLIYHSFCSMSGYYKLLCQPGDILWVRETFCEVPYEHNHVPIKGGHITIPKYAYKADSERDYTGIWKPSIHMPREAARIFLRVKTVRVERLQDITPKDAWDEGCRIGNSFPWEEHIPELQQQCRDILFIPLWDRFNRKRGYGWDTNPWVWVIEFERINKE